MTVSRSPVNAIARRPPRHSGSPLRVSCSERPLATRRRRDPMAIESVVFLGFESLPRWLRAESPAPDGRVPDRQAGSRAGSSWCRVIRRLSSALSSATRSRPRSALGGRTRLSSPRSSSSRLSGGMRSACSSTPFAGAAPVCSECASRTQSVRSYGVNARRVASGRPRPAHILLLRDPSLLQTPKEVHGAGCLGGQTRR